MTTAYTLIIVWTFGTAIGITSQSVPMIDRHSCEKAAKTVQANPHPNTRVSTVCVPQQER